MLWSHVQFVPNNTQYAVYSIILWAFHSEFFSRHKLSAEQAGLCRHRILLSLAGPTGKASNFPIMAFVSCGFEHSVANMYYLLVGMIAAVGYQSPFDIGILNLLLNLCVVTVGNVIGGAVIALGMRYINIRQE